MCVTPDDSRRLHRAHPPIEERALLAGDPIGDGIARPSADPPAEIDVEAISLSLRRRISTRLRPSELAEDVVQDAWTVFLLHPPQHREQILRWLHVVAARLARAHVRRARERERRERAVARPDAYLAASADTFEVPTSVVRLLDELREPYREVVHLRYLDELTTADVARRLGRPEATVRSQLKRGLDLMRSRLGIWS